MFLLLAILIPMATGGLLPLWKFKKSAPRAAYVFSALALTLTAAVLGALDGRRFSILSLGSGVELALAPDGVALFFAAVFLAAWIAVSIYTLLYITHEGKEDRFFAFLLLTLGGMLGVAFSENMVTLYLFFETATLFSMPTVLHSQTKESVSAALKYLFYSVAGAFLGLIGVFAVYYYSPDRAFRWGGTVDPALLGDGKDVFLWIVFFAVVGFATKAGMFPMHNWLPTAHPVAPAPASALLSGLITKAGVIAVLRLVFFTVGPDLLRGSWVQIAWIVLAMITVLMGSMMAYHEKVLKKRLAYSTVSNLSYILLGLFALSPEGIVGALLHVTAHATAKTCLFLAAGSIIFKTGKTRVDELRGIGREMPVTMWSFALASLSLIGIPPFAGFISKWHLALAALDALPPVLGVLVPVTLVLSALLTAGYLLPVVIAGFFPGSDYDLKTPKTEAKAIMTGPVLFFGLATLFAGIFASPLTELFTSFIDRVF
ncbi:MAG: proton-conducting membrane transporter [Clostridia bacterium]|nr:proton-conducting membrane transporter [Clostridia bacterium]